MKCARVASSRSPEFSSQRRQLLPTVRSATAAKQVVDAIATPQAIVQRRNFVTEATWKMLGATFDRTPFDPRVSGGGARRARAQRRTRRTVTDHRSLADVERYTQPFGISADGVLREFDLSEVTSAVGPRRVLLLDPSTPLGEPGATARDLYRRSAKREPADGTEDPLDSGVLDRERRIG